MELRFDRKTYSFAEPASPHTPIATDYHALFGHLLDGLDVPSDGNSNAFNDLSSYMLLRAQDGCTMVELSYIDIYHSNLFCMGLKVTYRSTFSNGNTSLSSASKHCYNYNIGFYSYHGGQMQVSNHHTVFETRDAELLGIHILKDLKWSKAGPVYNLLFHGRPTILCYQVSPK